MRSGELPKQSIPQLSPLFLRHTNDVRHDTAVWAAQQIIHVGPSYLDHVGDLSRFGPSGLQQHVSWPKWPVCSHSTYLGSPLHKLHISGFVFFLDIVPVLGNLVQFHVIVSKLLTKRIGNLVNSVNKCLRHIIHYNRLLLSKDMASWTWVGHKSNVPTFLSIWTAKSCKCAGSQSSSLVFSLYKVNEEKLSMVIGIQHIGTFDLWPTHVHDAISLLKSNRS